MDSIETGDTGVIEKLGFDAERFERAVDTDGDAVLWLEEMLQTGISGAQKGILEAAIDFPEAEFHSLLVKENGLKLENAAQLEKIVVKELNGKFPGANYDYEKAKADPVLNMFLARLYLGLLRNNYIERGPYSSWPEKDKVGLTLFMYNMGPSATGRLFRKFGGTNLSKFMASVEKHYLAYRGEKTDPVFRDVKYPSYSKLKISTEYVKFIQELGSKLES